MNTVPLSKELVLDTLRQVIDPEIGCNIVDLGLVYRVTIDNGFVTVLMTLTTPGCPMHGSICDGARHVLLGLEEVSDVDVQLVWDPPWNPSMITERGRQMLGVTNF